TALAGARTEARHRSRHRSRAGDYDRPGLEPHRQRPALVRRRRDRFQRRQPRPPGNAMTEYRRAKRKHAKEVIEVHDCMTEQVIGRIGNLSETGMMLMCSRPPFDDALFQLRFTINDEQGHSRPVDRKSTRLNSSHVKISYAVFCLKKKKKR